MGISLEIKKNQALTILPVSQRVSLSSHIQSHVSSLEKGKTGMSKCIQYAL